MASWFGLGRTTNTQVKDETTRALPASWYHSPAMYELERRAIFSKKWILVSHKLRFSEPGTFVRITEAGFPLFLIKDRQGSMNAFHNVCRHRAYPLIEKDCGKTSALACKYHGEYRPYPCSFIPCLIAFTGWSYGFNGKLAKAPKYQDLEGFNKDVNGLYPIHVHVDRLGFIWVNLDSKENPTTTWNGDFEGFDTQSRLQAFDMTKYRFDHQWEMNGDYNWKTLADNYNEV